MSIVLMLDLCDVLFVCDGMSLIVYLYILRKVYVVLVG